MTNIAPQPATSSPPEYILRKSAELFARNGYHATGISELITELGVSRGALYHHIDGKETLLFEICRAQVELMNAVAADIVALELPAAERLRLLARSLFRNIADHLNEWTVFFREFGALSADRVELILKERNAYEEYWQRLITEGRAAGSFRGTSPLLVKGLLGMFNYAYLWYRPGGPSAPEEIADEFIDAILNGITAD